MPLSTEDLRFNPPSFDQAVLARVALDLFELQGELEPLLTELQTYALVHLEKASPEISVPGVSMGVTGNHGNVLELRPPLPFTRDNADHALEVLDGCLRALRLR